MGRDSNILVIENVPSNISTEFKKRKITQKRYDNIEDIFKILNDEEVIYDYIYIYKLVYLPIDITSHKD